MSKISRVGDGDDGSAEDGDDDVSGPDAAAAPGEKLRADQAEISQLAGETVEVKDVTWTVVEFVGDLDEVAPDVLQSGRDVFAPGIAVEREIDAFTHMLWMDIPEMATVINQAAWRDPTRRDRWKAVSARELGIWFGLLLGSLQFAERGDALWDSTRMLGRSRGKPCQKVFRRPVRRRQGRRDVRER